MQKDHGIAPIRKKMFHFRRSTGISEIFIAMCPIIWKICKNIIIFP